MRILSTIGLLTTLSACQSPCEDGWGRAPDGHCYKLDLDGSTGGGGPAEADTDTDTDTDSDTDTDTDTDSDTDTDTDSDTDTDTDTDTDPGGETGVTGAVILDGSLTLNDDAWLQVEVWPVELLVDGYPSGGANQGAIVEVVDTGAQAELDRDYPFTVITNQQIPDSGMEVVVFGFYTTDGEGDAGEPHGFTPAVALIDGQLEDVGPFAVFAQE